MERFAFKIDEKLKANLYKICRLCGIDNPCMEPILKQENDVKRIQYNEDSEPELSQKIKDCIGFIITTDDHMPQAVCILCSEKINDFHEFREMCFATNIQTRKLLGLKTFQTTVKTYEGDKTINLIKDEPDLKGKRGRKRKSDEIIDLVVKNEVPTTTSGIRKRGHEVGSKKSRLKLQQDYNLVSQIKVELGPPRLPNMCDICNQNFVNKTKLAVHQAVMHLPSIYRFFCSACNEDFMRNIDFKSHTLWHKLSKTPFKCGLCQRSANTNNLYTRHLREHFIRVPPSALVLDRQCPECNAMFVTNFLFNTHTCAVRTKKCVCLRTLRTELDYLRHCSTCSMAYYTHVDHIPSKSGTTTSNVRIKNENDFEADVKNSILEVDLSPVVSLKRLSVDELKASGNQGENLQISQNESASNRPKAAKKSGYYEKDLKRVDDLLKSTMVTLVTIKQEPEEQHTGIDRTSESSAAPLNGNTENMPRPEALESESNDRQPSIGESCHSQENHDNDDDPINNKIPTLKIKIKKEHGTLNSSLLNNDDESVRTTKKKKKKKHKDSESSKDKSPNTEQTADAHPSSTVRIKLEPTEHNESTPHNIQAPYGQAFATESASNHIMTSIPMMQFQITCVNNSESYGCEQLYGNKEDEHEVEERDIKPNVAELNKIKISSVSSGLDIIIKQEPKDTSYDNFDTVQKKAFNGDQAYDEEEYQMSASTTIEQQSIAEESDMTTDDWNKKNDSMSLQMPELVIKPEPFDAGYMDVVDDFHFRNISEPLRLSEEHNKVFTQSNNEVAIFDPNMRFKMEPGLYDDREEPQSVINNQKETQENEENYNEFENSLLEEQSSNSGKIEHTFIAAKEPLKPLFVISNVCSVHPSMDDKLESSNETTERAESISIQINVPKELPTEAQPFEETNPTGVSIGTTDSLGNEEDEEPEEEEGGNESSRQENNNNSEIEEQQNLLNHEVLEQANSSDMLSTIATAEDVTLPSSSSNKTTNEETENQFNEQAVERRLQLQQIQETQSQSTSSSTAINTLLDCSDINEIAENNNNANIERELQDDSNGHTVDERIRTEQQENNVELSLRDCSAGSSDKI